MLRVTFAVALFAACISAGAQQDSREADASRVMQATAIDRLILANARSIAAANPKAEQSLDDHLYRLRGPVLWDPKHAAWGPARKLFKERVAAESNQWVQEYWREAALKIHVRELASSYRPADLAIVREFAESPGGQAYFARRLAEARVKSGEAFFSLDPANPAVLDKVAADARRRFDALPATEKQRVAAFLEGRPCDACGRSHVSVLESYISEQSRWIGEVLVTHLGSIPYATSDTWIADIGAKLGAELPVDSKKQLLGTLEMRGDATLVFRFTFYWKDAINGGSLALEFPKTGPQYAEVLALAPGLAAGQSRVLYRDLDGVVSDRP
jgi:hypothetical protein